MREFKVGLLVITALIALGAGVFLVGESNNLFVRKNHYFVRFETVAGLAEGNPVQLNGVTVGRVRSIELPQAADEPLLVVNLAVDKRYADRVRTDSEARIKTLGLLGDKFIQLASGSPDAPATQDGGEISAAQATDVDQLIASGESAVDNFVAISVSLRNILSRMESGEGILGQLTADSETGMVARDKLLTILTSFEKMALRAERGEGSLGRLLSDDTFVVSLEASLDRLNANLELLETGDGILPALLRDAEAKERFELTLDNLSSAADEMSQLASAMRDGGGLLPRLINDEDYGEQITRDLERLLGSLGSISERLESGDGSAAQLINDPEIYQALQDIVVGIDESKLLSWLIRNRQKKGIKKRYDQARAEPAVPEEAQP